MHLSRWRACTAAATEKCQGTAAYRCELHACAVRLNGAPAAEGEDRPSSLPAPLCSLSSIHVCTERLSSSMCSGSSSVTGQTPSSAHNSYFEQSGTTFCCVELILTMGSRGNGLITCTATR
jgi:hypothetical protein